MLKQMATFFEEASLLGPYISGFRKGHSTATSLLGIQDDLKYSVMIEMMCHCWCSLIFLIFRQCLFNYCLKDEASIVFLFQKILEVYDKLLIKQARFRAN